MKSTHSRSPKGRKASEAAGPIDAVLRRAYQLYSRNRFTREALRAAARA